MIYLLLMMFVVNSGENLCCKELSQSIVIFEVFTKKAEN